MKYLFRSLALAGVLAAVPHHSVRAQATDTTKTGVATKKAAAKAGKEAHPRLVAARKKLEEAKKELQAAPDDFGGHKAAAIKSIDEALNHLQLALAADKK
jgi:hypothetical protein